MQIRFQRGDRLERGAQHQEIACVPAGLGEAHHRPLEIADGQVPLGHGAKLGQPYERLLDPRNGDAQNEIGLAGLSGMRCS